jgi:PAB1-binding protein PBP1
MPDQEQDISKAPEIQTIVDGLVDAQHENLKDAKILCFWTKKPMRAGGKPVIGKAAKVTDAQRVMFGKNIHFFITVSRPNWDKLREDQQSPAMDDLLCRCWMSEGNPSITPPDFTGYIANLKKYGFWQDDGDQVARAAQDHLPGLGDAAPVKSKKRGAGTSTAAPAPS